MTTFVLVKRVAPLGVSAFEDEAFAPLPSDGVSVVGFLAARACATFARWGVDAGQVFLHLAAAGGEDEPSAEAVAAARARAHLPA